MKCPKCDSEIKTIRETSQTRMTASCITETKIEIVCVKGCKYHCWEHTASLIYWLVQQGNSQLALSLQSKKSNFFVVEKRKI